MILVREFHLVVFLIIIFILLVLLSLDLWWLLFILWAEFVFHSFIIININWVLLPMIVPIINLLLLLLKLFNAVLPINMCKFWIYTLTWSASVFFRGGWSLLASWTATPPIKHTRSNTCKLWLLLLVVYHRVLVDTLIRILLIYKVLLTHLSQLGIIVRDLSP